MSKYKTLPQQLSPIATKEHYSITLEPIEPHELKDSRQELSPEDDALLAKLFHLSNNNPEKITSPDCEYFIENERLRAKYPGNPTPLNYLTIGYNLINQPEKARDLLFETCEKFPNYLFALVAKAMLLIQEGKPDEAYSTVRNCQTIKQLYPHRDVFHIGEVKSFHYFQVTYCCCKRNIEEAEIHLKILKHLAIDILGDPDEPVYDNAAQQVGAFKALSKLFTRSSTKTKAPKPKPTPSNKNQLNLF